jgi:hypothetical protein
MPEEITVPGTRVALWGGWSLALPECYFERTPNGPWSAWGGDWTVDVQIVELGGDVDGQDISAETLYAIQPGQKKRAGPGWVGSADILIEQDAGRDVYRLAGRMCAVNTIMSCWVSYVREDQTAFAQGIIETVAHRPA